MLTRIIEVNYGVRRIDMNKVVLNSGLFKQSEEKGKSYLLYLDVDRLVAPCYEAIGKEPKNKRYGGWESMEIAGHSIGHWLSAAAMMYHVTGDEKMKEKLDYAVAELSYLQSFDSEGYVSGFAKDCFEEVFTGDFRVESFGLGGSWVPWYSIHKIYAGLIDAYRLTGNIQALAVVKNLSDWAYKGLSKLTDEQFQRMLTCEYGGMNEVMADMYEITNDPRYLDLAIRFCDQSILNPLIEGVDHLEGQHANTQFPKVIGAAKLYDVTGDEVYKKLVTFFWEQVINHRSYVIGGNSNAEHFGPIDTEPLGVLTTETCNTYNMLKLTEYLFDWSPDSRYMDYYENGLYNHILASQDPDSGMKTYFVSTEPGHFKVYCSPDDSFWCCTGSGMENPARYTKNIYTRKDNALYVNLFINSTITLEDKEIQLVQETTFPTGNKSEILVKEANGAELSIKIRVPYWLTGNMNTRINDELVNGEVINGYLELKREWTAGDRIVFDLPMKLHRYVSKDDPQKQAFMYGPIVLAGALGKENFPETDIVADHQQFNNYKLIDVPTLVTAEDDLDKWIKLIDDKTLTFETKAIGQPGSVIVKMVPFYALHHERYTLYWKVMNEKEFASFVDHEKEAMEKLRAITVDHVQPGEQQPEKDHQVKAKNSETGYLNIVHQSWRDAKDVGYFSYQMAVDGKLPMFLLVTYYGGDGKHYIDGKAYQRDFTIEVDGSHVAKQTLISSKAGELIDVCYPIPTVLTKSKEKVEVKFTSTEGNIAGGIYGVRIINANTEI